MLIFILPREQKEEKIMRITRIVFIVLVSILSLTLLAQGILAATSTGSSEAIITFQEDTSIPPILDPDDGTTPNNENPPLVGTGNSGPLSLDYVSNLHFGIQKVSMETKTYNSTTLKPFVQVTDKRGESNGWDVVVKATAFRSSSEDTLDGAYLEFGNGEVLTNLVGVYGPPKTAPFTLFTNEEAVKFLYANVNEGRGSWITRWYPSTGMETNDKVTLTVYGGTMKAETYTSTLTWTLTDAP